MAQQRSPSTRLIVILIVGMLFTGCSNSLWSKWQDMQCVANCDSPDPALRKTFEQPVFQTATMFLGETLCLAAFLFLASPLNPFRQVKRSTASASARRAAQSAQSSRLANAPLSRPDESAIYFNESDISLRNEDFDSAGSGGVKETGPVKLDGWQKAFLFWGPACCDICGTTAMNIGLLFVPVSVYQMLRGALVLFVGLFSVIFLGRRLTRAQWMALATVMLGVAVVGFSSVGGAKKEIESFAAATGGEEADPLLGVCLILVAQIFTATQFVLEEKIMEVHSVEPLLAVGYEGAFGLSTTLVGLPILYVLFGRTAAGQGGYFDAPTGWNQIVSNPTVWGSSIAIAVSIAFFNFCGLAVTKIVSATARSTIDTCRTVGIWIVSLYLGWEHFKYLQVVGFSLLVYGTFVFNGIARFPGWTRFHLIDDDLPTITLTQSDEDEDSEDDDEARSRSSGALSRPVTRRSGSGRRGEVSPLLKNVGE